MGKSRFLGGIFLVAVLLTATVALAALPPGGTFTDDNGNVFEGAIEGIAAEGITQGCNPPTNDRYCPNDFVTRGQMAVFLARALNYVDNGAGDLFVDDDGLFYENAADMLKTAGVTLGCNPPRNDRYCGEDVVTRGQMAAFLVRSLGLTDDGGGNLYRDDNNSIFELAIDRLGASGITQGCNPPINDRFCPNDYVTRGQMAAFLSRALGLTPITPPPPTSSTSSTTPTVPSPSGFPSASNTGVPPGVSLSPSGSITVNSPTTINAKDVSGTISVNASNVTIKNTRVEGHQGDFAMIWVNESATNVVIEDCELDGSAGGDNSMGVIGPVTVRRCDIHGVENGIQPFSGSVVEDNYIHDLSAPDSPHYDGMQINGSDSNIVVRHNTIINDHDQTAAFGIWNDFGGVSDVLVENNRLIGGGYTLYVRGDAGGGGTVTSITIRDNRLGEGYWGFYSIVQASVDWSGNVDDSTGQSVNYDG